MDDRLKPIYSCFVLPKSGRDFPALVAKFARLRLQALRESPHAFISDYETEAAFTPAQWTAYLQMPRRNTFICVQTCANDAEEPSLLHHDWVASIQLLGSYPLADWKWPASDTLHADSVELRWHVTGAYVSKAHRRCNPPLLARLIFFFNDWQVNAARELLGHLRRSCAVGQRAPTMVWTRQRSNLTPDNLSLRRFYERLGTMEAGKITAAEDFVANENGYPLPPRDEEHHRFYEVRDNTAFELVLEVTEDTVYPEGLLMSRGAYMCSNEERYAKRALGAGQAKPGYMGEAKPVFMGETNVNAKL